MEYEAAIKVKNTYTGRMKVFTRKGVLHLGVDSEVYELTSEEAGLLSTLLLRGAYHADLYNEVDIPW